MLKVTFMRENGLKIKQMASVYTLISMEADMKVNGFKINSMGTESNSGLMEQNMKDNTNKE